MADSKSNGGVQQPQQQPVRQPQGQIVREQSDYSRRDSNGRTTATGQTQPPGHKK